MVHNRSGDIMALVQMNDSIEEENDERRLSEIPNIREPFGGSGYRDGIVI
jgi:hypothetical protein